MACQDLASMSPTEVKTFFDSYDTVLTDCDGVLWKGKFTTLIHFLTFPVCFSISKVFNNLNLNCSNLLDLRNLQEEVKKAFCYQKLF